MHNLVTFGSQHMGVSDIQPCKPFDVTCQLARRGMRNGVYSAWAQHNIVPVRPLPVSFTHYPQPADH